MTDVTSTLTVLSTLYGIGPRERYKTLRDTLTDGRDWRATDEYDLSPFRFPHVRATLFPEATAFHFSPFPFNFLLFTFSSLTMSDIVLKVEGLTKKYTIGENRERYVALRDVLVRKVRQSVKALGAIWGNGSQESTPPDNEIYALKDISFAFAVAAHLEPEILLVDEVLAVGGAGVIS